MSFPQPFHVVQAARLPRALRFARTRRGIEVCPLFEVDSQVPPPSAFREVLERSFKAPAALRFTLQEWAEWFGVRLTTGACRLAWGGDARPSELPSVSGVRLARWLTETIQGRTDSSEQASVLPQGLIERRHRLARTALDLQPPACPAFVKTAVNMLRRGGRALWLPGLLLSERSADAGITPSGLDGLSNSLDRFAQQLLEPGAPLSSLLALAATRSSPVEVRPAREVIADRRFLDSSPPGALLQGSVAPYQTLTVERLSLDSSDASFRVGALAPEHIAETPDGGFVHWPAVRVGLLLCNDPRQLLYPGSGALTSGFQLWEPALRWHPIVSWSDSGRCGSVCVSDTVALAVHRAAADGLPPGAVLALALVTARDTLLYGVNQQNWRSLYRRYDRVSTDGGAPRYTYLSRQEARDLAATRRIELIPWHRGVVVPDREQVIVV
ncbi:MAG: hypothetical protein ABIO70_15640 [Pseudomonadota bacterium]